MYVISKVPETGDESNTPTEFQEFSNLLLNAQRIADDSKKAHFFTWKGYKACVSSELPKFTTVELSRRYKLAMKSIENVVTKEVSFFRSTYQQAFTFKINRIFFSHLKFPLKEGLARHLLMIHVLPCLSCLTNNPHRKS